MGSPADTVRRLASFKSRRPQGSDASYWTLPLTHGWDEGRGSAEGGIKGSGPKRSTGIQKEDRVGSNRFCFQIPVETKFVKDLKLGPSPANKPHRGPHGADWVGGGVPVAVSASYTHPQGLAGAGGAAGGSSVSVERQLLKEIKSPTLPIPHVQALGLCLATSQTRPRPPRKEGLNPARLRALPRAIRLNFAPSQESGPPRVRAERTPTPRRRRTLASRTTPGRWLLAETGPGMARGLGEGLRPAVGLRSRARKEVRLPR